MSTGGVRQLGWQGLSPSWTVAQSAGAVGCRMALRIRKGTTFARAEPPHRSNPPPRSTTTEPKVRQLRIERAVSRSPPLWNPALVHPCIALYCSRLSVAAEARRTYWSSWGGPRRPESLLVSGRFRVNTLWAIHAKVHVIANAQRGNCMKLQVARTCAKEGRRYQCLAG